MRILFLSRWYPFPADNGSKIRVFNLIKSLARHHEIHLISFVTDAIQPEHIMAMHQYCASVETFPFHEFQPNRSSALMRLLSPRPRYVDETFSKELYQATVAAGQREQFDLVLASQTGMAPYALAVPHVPKVLEEAELSVYRDQYLKERHPVRRLRKWLMWEKCRRYFAYLLKRYHGATVVSEPELIPIQETLPGFAPVALVANGADIERFTGNFGQPQPNTIVYTGALTYYVNFDAMQFFLREVFPLVQQAIPEVTIKIAGRLEGVAVDQLPSNPGVIYTGHQSDIRPLIAQSWVSVVPERIGGGTRIKVPESMALGTPVVATTRGATGLLVRDGHDILVADQPRQMADAIIRLLRDPQLREQISRNGRRTVEQHYDWRIIGDQLDDVLATIVQQSQRAPRVA
ncbi:MAG: glycosyltransferase family 4 protein [Roseiflexaceae bacterium]